MFAIKTTIVNKDYYDKNSCRFVLFDILLRKLNYSIFEYFFLGS
jgi:hypothetical protein